MPCVFTYFVTHILLIQFRDFIFDFLPFSILSPYVIYYCGILFVITTGDIMDNQHIMRFWDSDLRLQKTVFIPLVLLSPITVIFFFTSPTWMAVSTTVTRSIYTSCLKAIGHVQDWRLNHHDILGAHTHQIHWHTSHAWSLSKFESLFMMEIVTII